MMTVRQVFYPQNHVGRGLEIRNGAIGAVRLPKILVLTIGTPSRQAKPLTRSQKVLQKTFPVQTKSFSQTYERVLGQYSTRNDMLQTSVSRAAPCVDRGPEKRDLAYS